MCVCVCVLHRMIDHGDTVKTKNLPFFTSVHKGEPTNFTADVVASDLLEAVMLSEAEVHPAPVSSSSTVWCWLAVVRH